MHKQKKSTQTLGRHLLDDCASNDFCQVPNYIKPPSSPSFYKEEKIKIR